MAKTMHIPYNGMDFQFCCDNVRNAIMRCGWQITAANQTGIYVTVPLSFLSWGENITVQFFQDGFVITSACIMPLQIFDWGKNNSNLKKFYAAYNACCQGW